MLPLFAGLLAGLVLLVLAVAALLGASLTRATEAFAAGLPEAPRGAGGPYILGGAGPWPLAPCAPPAVFREARAFLRGLPGFGPATPAELEAVAAFAREASRRHGFPLAPRALLQLRTMELATEAQRSGVRALRAGPELASGREKKVRVVELARRLRLPPVAALRSLLVEAGFPEGEVRAMVADPRRLPADLAAEAAEIFEADLGSRAHAGRIRAEAQAFEDRVEAALRAAFPGAGLATEADLRRAPDPRGPTLTPDFLFAAPVAVGGRRVGWVDAKNYPLADQPLVLKSLEKQAAKYTKAFGPGAFVFAGGVVCGSRLARRADLLLLDGSHLEGGA